MAVAKNMKTLLFLSILTFGVCFGAAYKFSDSNGWIDKAYGFHGDTLGVAKAREIAMGRKAEEKCSYASDCANTKCHGCTVIQCAGGVCGCGCPFDPQPPMHCARPEDCGNYCHGCSTGCLQGSCKCYC